MSSESPRPPDALNKSRRRRTVALIALASVVFWYSQRPSHIERALVGYWRLTYSGDHEANCDVRLRSDGAVFLRGADGEYAIEQDRWFVRDGDLKTTTLDFRDRINAISKWDWDALAGQGNGRLVILTPDHIVLKLSNDTTTHFHRITANTPPIPEATKAASEADP